MEFAIDAEGFEGRQLTLQMNGITSAPRLLLDGEPVKGSRGRFVLRREDAREVNIKVKPNLIDPIPRIVIDGRVLQLVRPFAWYEYAWIGLPILLVFAGGALGGMCGLWGAYASGRVFRSQSDPVRKYALTGAISILAVVAYFILSTLFQKGV